jgi:26S proteasome regulatory subunit N5
MSILTTSQNLRVIASYYSRITMTTERTICKLVTDKTIYARIDRPAGIVSFKQTKGVNEVLNAWSGDIAKMLSLVEKTSHLVAKVGWIRWWESAIATTCSRSAKT